MKSKTMIRSYLRKQKSWQRRTKVMLEINRRALDFQCALIQGIVEFYSPEATLVRAIRGR